MSMNIQEFAQKLDEVLELRALSKEKEDEIGCREGGCEYLILPDVETFLLFANLKNLTIEMKYIVGCTLYNYELFTFYKDVKLTKLATKEEYIAFQERGLL